MRRNSFPYSDLLRDLPKPLQRAVHEMVAQCQPCHCPRLYARDWQEELYHEAVAAACDAWASYNPAKGSLYGWGRKIILQRLQSFCERVWGSATRECAYPRDEETGEEVEFADGGRWRRSGNICCVGRCARRWRSCQSESGV